MKRAVVVTKEAQVPAAPIKKPEKPTRLCARENCGTPLKPTQKKFCSHACKHADGITPSKYKPEYAGALMDSYLTWCAEGNEPTLVPTKTGYITIPNARMPSKDGFVEYLIEQGHQQSLHPTTLDNWVKDHPDFALAMDRLVRKQKLFLIDHGLSGRYQSPIARLVLSVNHGMHEKKLIDKKTLGFGIVKHLYETADKLSDEGQLPPP